MTNVIQCFNEKVLDNLMEKANYNFDCINIILEFAGYKYRNGKYMKQFENDDPRASELTRMPKICKVPTNNSKPYFRVVINKPRLGIKYVHVISTSIYFDTVHWHMDLGTVKYDAEGNEKISYIVDIHKYIYRKHTKENRPCNSNFFKKRLGI
jgi:hypothetical protein